MLPFVRMLGVAHLSAAVGPDGTNELPTCNSYLAALALKMVGVERIGRSGQLRDDIGVALFSGLRAMPEQSVLHRFLGRFDSARSKRFFKHLAACLCRADRVRGRLIGVDFHVVPTYPVKSSTKRAMPKEWLPMKGRPGRGKRTLIAQDLDTLVPILATSRLGKKATGPLQDVVRFCHENLGSRRPAFVFDARVTTYKGLDRLNRQGIKFYTLRCRCKRLTTYIKHVPDCRFGQVKLDSPRRKYRKVRLFDSLVTLSPQYKGKVRQIVMVDHGRKEPTIIITNDRDSSAKEIAETYTRRTRIENKIQDMVAFLGLNALPSYFWVKADANLAFIILASNVYQLFNEFVLGSPSTKPRTVFDHYIHHMARIKAVGADLVVTFDRFKGGQRVKYFYEHIEQFYRSAGMQTEVPWLGSRRVRYTFS